jgi:GT2 family glycosyltransferase
MSGDVLVSVIVPAYNVESFLTETLESLQAQTYPHWEALVVDDASTDNTRAVAERFSRTDQRVCVLGHEKNTGVSSARNDAIARARGEWLAFLDADDVWMPEKLALQLELAQQFSPASFVFSNYMVWDEGREVGTVYPQGQPLPRGDVRQTLAERCLFGTSSVLVRRELVLGVGGFDTSLKYAEDWDLWLRLAERGMHVEGLSQPLMKYRRWGGKISFQEVAMARGAVQVFEKALARSQPLEIERRLRVSLASAQRRWCLMEATATAVHFADTNSKTVVAALWRAWRLEPRRLEYLLWSLLMRWPGMCGGAQVTEPVKRRLRRKFRGKAQRAVVSA